MTKKTKLYIIPMTIFLFIFTSSVIVFFYMFLARPFTFLHLVLITSTCIICAYIIYAIAQHVIRGKQEKLLAKEYYLKYEMVKNIIKSSCLSRREKKDALLEAINILLSKQTSNKSEYRGLEDFDSYKYANDYIARLGYKSSFGFNLLNSCILSALIIFIMQVLNYVGMISNFSFYDVTLRPFNVLYVLFICFFSIPLHKYFLKNNKLFLAGIMPIFGTILYFVLIVILDAQNIDSQLINYLMGGYFMFIRTNIRFVIFLSSLPIFFLLKALLRSYYKNLKGISVISKRQS